MIQVTMISTLLVLVFATSSCKVADKSAAIELAKPVQSRTDPADAGATQVQPQQLVLKFMVEHAPIELNTAPANSNQGGAEIVVLESFATADKAFTVFSAATQEDLQTYLDAAEITATKIIQVRDINSPTRGGGPQAGDQPKEGHNTYVIQRTIPGVGNFPDEKKQAISQKSNAAVAKIGDSVEWDHSYLTDEGTYCVYRATDEEILREHAKIAGAPVNTISKVNELPVAPK